jgi:two-component system sensor histidine kinase YesM
LGGLMMLVFMTVSVLLAFALYSQIIKPIRILRRQMESVELETLQDAFPTVTSLNDLVALEKTFSKMRVRLGEEVTRQLRSRELQMQANYDALQLQINPHFLYNVLHVITQKGLDSQNNEICEICSDLAAMMRYSTSTLQRTATIQEELNHVAAYVSLMQKRYENRINFKVIADEGVVCYDIPKMTLQQFVENAITHSFSAGLKEVSVAIQCVAYDSGWRIRIVDDGPGFSPDMLEQLTKEIPELQHKLLN